MSMTRKFAAAGIVTVLAFGGVACSDEDGDGATTDEEVGEIQDKAEDTGDQIQEEVDEGQNEAEE